MLLLSYETLKFHWSVKFGGFQSQIIILFLTFSSKSAIEPINKPNFIDCAGNMAEMVQCVSVYSLSELLTKEV